MRFLIDESLSSRVAAVLVTEGHDAIHVYDRDLAGKSDDKVMAVAAAEHRVLIAADTDFGTLLALSGRSEPSSILLRRTSHRPEAQAWLLLRNIERIEGDLDDGAFVVFSGPLIRVRRLPFTPRLP